MKKSFQKMYSRALPMLFASACAAALIFACISLFPRSVPKTESVAVQTLTPVYPQFLPCCAGNINPNTADKAALLSLPGIGEKTAENILLARDDGAVFHYPEDLMQISGIGEKKLVDILPCLTFQ